jgi:CheY-like chemotaxis protein/HPt (histidine-containing phosphotransfer) domain-containing protein
MGGSIGVSSRLGEGSTFWFTVCLQAGRSARVTAGPETGGAVPPYDHALLRDLFAHSAARILVADDNISNLQVAQGMLKKMGLAADAVADGGEALQALSSVPYDLVLMDVRMPGMDGLEATKRIRQSELASQASHLPVIAMTASATQSDQDKCLEAGMDDFLSKPVMPHALADVLKKWLPAAHARSHAAGDAKVKLNPVYASQSVPDNTPIFNRSALLARLLGNQDLAAKVLAGFLDDMPRQILSLAQFVESGDAGGVEDQAHRIKGAAATVSGEAMRAVAAEMERAGQSGSLAAVPAYLATLQAEFARLREAIKDSLADPIRSVESNSPSTHYTNTGRKGR